MILLCSSGGAHRDQMAWMEGYETPSERPEMTLTPIRSEVWVLARAGVRRVNTAVVVIPNRKILLPPYFVAK